MTVPSRISIVTPGVADLGRATASYEALGWQRRPEAADAVASEPAERSPFFDDLDGCFLDPDGHAREVAHDPDLHGPPR